MPPPKRFSIEIATERGKRMVTCIAKRGAICVHENITFPGEYNVTHMPTGKSLAHGLHKRTAIRALELIGDWPEWATVGQSGSNYELGVRLRQAITRAKIEDRTQKDLKKT